MSIVFVTAGAAIVALTIADLLSTTLSVASVKGLVSGRLASKVWRQVLRLRLSHQRLRRVGMVLVSGFIAGWAVMSWLGWTPVFLGAGDAVVNSTTCVPASFSDRIFYAGYLVSTLGNGDFTRVGRSWQIASVLASITGLVAVTLAITFMVPLVSGVVHRRQVAATISTLGDTPARLLARMWDGEGFSPLADHLSGLLSELHLLTQRHTAYPMMHYFHSDQRHEAIAPMLAVLDEALLVLEHGVDRPGIAELTVGATRDSGAEFLRLLDGGFVTAAAHAPPDPDLAWVRRLGARTVDDGAFDRVVRGHSRRRRILLGFVEGDGWGWNDLHEVPEDEHLDFTRSADGDVPQD